MKNIFLSIVFFCSVLLTSAAVWDMDLDEVAAKIGPMQDRVSVGIIGTGMLSYHDDLDEINVVGHHFDFHEASEDDDDDIDDEDGLGTALAGLIAAEDNGSGGTGFAVGCDLSIARVHGALDEIVAAIDWMNTNGTGNAGVDIILSAEPALSIIPDVIETNSHILFVLPDSEYINFEAPTNCVIVGRCNTTGDEQETVSTNVTCYAPHGFLTTTTTNGFGYYGYLDDVNESAALATSLAAWLWLAYPEATMVKRALEGYANGYAWEGYGGLHGPSAMAVPQPTVSVSNYVFTATGSTVEAARSNALYQAEQIMGDDVQFLRWPQTDQQYFWRWRPLINENH